MHARIHTSITEILTTHNCEIFNGQLMELVAGEPEVIADGGRSGSGSERATVTPHVFKATAAQRKRLREVRGAVTFFVCFPLTQP